MSTQFTATVKPSSGDYTSLKDAAYGLANNITAADIKVFSISAYSTPTIAAGDTVLGQTSGATGECVLVNAARTQILIKTVAVASFLSGEKVQKTSDANVNVTLSNAGDSPIIGIECYSMSDNLGVQINAPWKTGASNYLRIYTPKSERHNGKWDDTKYKLEISVAYNTYCISTGTAAYAKIDGLQISADATSTNSLNGIGIPIYSPEFSHIEISNCIIKGINNNYGSAIYNNNSLGYIYNNIIYDFTNIDLPSYGIYTHTTTNMYIYNNTFINCDYGVRGTSFTLLKNNLFYLCSIAPTLNATAANCGYNSTDAASLGYVSQTGDRTSQIFTFVNELNDDFHLAISDTGARTHGLTDPSAGLFLDDIDGQMRPINGWDIGADQISTCPGIGILFTVQ